MRHWLPFLIALGVGGSSACSSSAPPQPSSTAKAAAFSVVPKTPMLTLAGEPTDLATVVRGRVALVSLWATWCDACAKEMDGLNRLSASTHGRADAVVVGVAIGEPRATVLAFAQQRGLEYAQVVDEEFVFADALGQRRLPATLVVDRSGRVIFRGDALDASSLAAFRRALGDPAE